MGVTTHDKNSIQPLSEKQAKSDVFSAFWFSRNALLHMYSTHMSLQSPGWHYNFCFTNYSTAAEYNGWYTCKTGSSWEHGKGWQDNTTLPFSSGMVLLTHPESDLFFCSVLYTAWGWGVTCEHTPFQEKTIVSPFYFDRIFWEGGLTCHGGISRNVPNLGNQTHLQLLWDQQMTVKDDCFYWQPVSTLWSSWWIYHTHHNMHRSWQEKYVQAISW
jgi:hypothetical protein